MLLSLLTELQYAIYKSLIYVCVDTFKWVYRGSNAYYVYTQYSVGIDNNYTLLLVPAQ